MFKIFRTFLLILFLVSTTTAVYSETSFITKKSDKTKVESKKIEKKIKKNTTTTWIKKKKVKENKKKLKEKIKESKSWITKKSKDKIKKIKKNLKKHKNIEDLPKANFYFTAIIEPIENEKPKYLYGYINSNKKSKTFKFKNQPYYTINDGIAYFENQKYSCEVNLKQNTTINLFVRDIVLDCTKFNVTGAFVKKNDIGGFEGEATDGNKVLFEITKSKSEAIASLKKIKRKPKGTTILVDDNNYDDNLLDLKVNGKYYALLIGNSNYAKYANWTSLNSPKNDVLEIAKVLRSKYKFAKVITAVDANKKEMENKLNELAELTTDKDYVLIYYSGHGEKKANSTYWIPIDGPKKWKYGSWISISEVGNFIENISAHHLVLMVDSCYTGSSFKGTNESNLSTKNYDHFKMLAQKLLNKRARYVLSSGGNEPVDDSFDGKHSIFAKSFLDSLKTADVINMESIYRRIDRAHGEMNQRPYLYSPEMWGHLGGDFIFIAKK